MNLRIGTALVFLFATCSKPTVPSSSDSTAAMSPKIPLKADSGHAPVGIVTRLPTSDSVVALTFDACESNTPSYFDSTILNYLLKEKLPFVLFLGGKFAVRNRPAFDTLVRYDNIEFANHSYNHVLHMERLNDSTALAEFQAAEDSIRMLTGLRTMYFRFPGGHYDARSLAIAESLGYRVVHWSFESGDPDSTIKPARLTEWVLEKTRPGSILIFHINGRGYSTGLALPSIVSGLRKKGYRFVRVSDYVTRPLLSPN